MSFSWTPETREQLQQLRSEGLSQQKCAIIIGCSDAAVFNALHPEKRPIPKQQQRKSSAPNLSPPHRLNSSCPVHINKLISPEQRALKQTKSELYRILAAAVRRTT
jgi:hypothetical protein